MFRYIFKESPSYCFSSLFWLRRKIIWNLAWEWWCIVLNGRPLPRKRKFLTPPLLSYPTLFFWEIVGINITQFLGNLVSEESFSEYRNRWMEELDCLVTLPTTRRRKNREITSLQSKQLSGPKVSLIAKKEVFPLITTSHWPNIFKTAV